MIEIPIDYIKPGDVLAKIHTFKKFDGGMSSSVDLMKGYKLTENIINKLKTEYNVNSLKIEDHSEEFIDLELDEGYDETERQKAIKVLVENMNEVRDSGLVDINEIGKLVEDIVNNIFRLMKDGKGGLTTLSKIFSKVQTHDTYTWEHSVNAAIYSAVTAFSLSEVFNKNKIETLVFNMLLHDIGKIRIPLEILNKDEKLTGDEFKKIQKHPFEGYVYLQKMNEKLKKKNMTLIPSTYRVACLHHHQNYNGSGYPSLKINGDLIRPYSGEEIPLVGRVAAVADMFDALTSKRPYRRPFHPKQALELLEAEANKKLDPNIVAAIKKNVRPFPKGTTVQLNTDELGIIVGFVNGNKFNPIVKPILKKIFKDGQEQIIRFFHRQEIEILPNSKVQIVINKEIYNT